MAGYLSSDDLLARASQLNELAGHFDVRAAYFHDDLGAADTFVADLTAAWTGPRADNDIECTSNYIDEIRPMDGGLADVARHLRQFAASAEELAGWMGPHETALAEAVAATPDGESLPQEAWDAQRRIEALNSDWLTACNTHASALDTAKEPLEVAHTSFVSGFWEPVTVGRSYATGLVALALAAGADITMLGLNGDEIRAGIEADLGVDRPTDVLVRLMGDPAGLMYWDLLSRDEQRVAVAEVPMLGFLVQSTEQEVVDAEFVTPDSGSYSPYLDPNGRLYQLIASTDQENFVITPADSARYRFADSYTIVPTSALGGETTIAVVTGYASPETTTSIDTTGTEGAGKLIDVAGLFVKDPRAQVVLLTASWLDPGSEEPPNTVTFQYDMNVTLIHLDEQHHIVATEDTVQTVRVEYPLSAIQGSDPIVYGDDTYLASVTEYAVTGDITEDEWVSYLPQAGDVQVLRED